VAAGRSAGGLLVTAPYDNIHADAYPALLMEVSLNDNRVGFWEGAKFAAKLRERKTNSNPVLLSVNMGSGHAGPSGRSEQLKELAFH